MITVIEGQYFSEAEELAGTNPTASVTGGRHIIPALTPHGRLRVDVDNGASRGMLFPGTMPPITTAANGVISVTAGVVTFTSASLTYANCYVGELITITDATHSVNNGTFAITAVNAGTNIQYANAAAVNTASGVGFTVQGNYIISAAAKNKFTAGSGSYGKLLTAAILSPGGGAVSVNWADGGADTFTMVAGFTYCVKVLQINTTGTAVTDLQIFL